MSQSNLHSFFTIVTAHNENHKKCFIYDSKTYKAFFISKPDDALDTFISIQSGLKLYIRTNPTIPTYSFPQMCVNTEMIPLLKSNLQKAIRRGHHSIAVSSALAILQLQPIQLLRRLPIIFVEDVELIDSLPIVIWFLMADKHYSLTSHDINILLQIVYSLSVCSKYFNQELVCVTKYTHEILENKECHNELLSLYYRSLYGGLKGDIVLLNDAIHYYSQTPQNIVRYIFINEIIPFTIDSIVTILPEAIDFHPFPTMITTISNKTYIQKQIIKNIIWFAESGYNYRKPTTIQLSIEYKNKPEYSIIAIHLRNVRQTLVTM